jgi:hypothetical protein
MHAQCGKLSSAIFLFVSCVALGNAQAIPIAPVDFDGVSLGATIVGPVGPTVDASLVNGGGDGIGDLISSVSCPSGFAACTPPTNAPGTIYTYLHEVTPGVDNPNDAPFPMPSVVLPVAEATSFRLGFPAHGFNGVAGYSFSDAASALPAGAVISLEQISDGSLVWTLPTGAGWSTGERIRFFWQTTQAPTGPGGTYILAADGGSGSGAGPLPAPIATVSAPSSLALFILAGTLLALANWRVRQRRTPI